MAKVIYMFFKVHLIILESEMIWESRYIIEIMGITMTFNFQIDIFGVEQLQKDGRITERDKLLVPNNTSSKDEFKMASFTVGCKI